MDGHTEVRYLSHSVVRLAVYGQVWFIWALYKGQAVLQNVGWKLVCLCANKHVPVSWDLFFFISLVRWSLQKNGASYKKLWCRDIFSWQNINITLLKHNWQIWFNAFFHFLSGVCCTPSLKWVVWTQSKTFCSVYLKCPTIMWQNVLAETFKNKRRQPDTWILYLAEYYTLPPPPSTHNPSMWTAKDQTVKKFAQYKIPYWYWPNISLA